MIEVGDRVFVSSVGEHGTVAQIVKTGIAGIVKYRVEFGDDRYRGGTYGAAFVQRAAYQGEPKTFRFSESAAGEVVALPRGRPGLRLAALHGVAL